MELTPFARLLPILALLALVSFVEFLVPLRTQARNERGRLPTNLTLIATTLLLGIAFNTALALGAVFVRAHGMGVLPVLGLGGPLEIVLGVIALDFAGYAVHVLMHKSALLWRIHRVHHIDVAVDATTALRQHPFEGLLRFTASAAAAWSLGLSVEAIALGRTLAAVNAIIEHANIRVPRWLDRSLIPFWVTPDMHKVHHSRVLAQTDSNYGNLFSFFDRLFGTYTRHWQVRPPRYGIDGFDAAADQSVAAAFALPFREENIRRTTPS